VSLTDRDRKIVLILVPLALIAAYWFLLLGPKRDQESKVRTELQSAQSQRDTARQAAAQLGTAKRSYATDYATVIELGKSIPTSVDMPSLLVQLDSAARGTGIKFVDIKTGDRSTGAGAAPASSGGSSSGSGSSGSSSSAPNGGTGPNAPGAPSAQSGPGQAAQTAGNAVNTANNAQSAAGLPASGGSPSSGGAAGGANSGNLDTVPLDFEFKGSFFNLADFFHRMKRFVRVANNQIVVHGRLIVINSFSFDSSQTFPAIDAKVHATVYLSPKSQGVSAGATPQGPAASTPASTPARSSSGSTSTPAAAVTAP
jgi:hypothetical protein